MMLIFNILLSLGVFVWTFTPLKTLSQEENVNSSSLDQQSPVFLEKYIYTHNGICYGISNSFGFVFSSDNGQTWEARNQGLPFKSVYPFETKKIRLITAIAADPVNPSRVAVSTSTAIYLSNDSGLNWSCIELKKPVPGSAYLTAVALSPYDPNSIIIGTSYDGIYETKDLGKTWHNLSPTLKFLYRGARFWEEVSALTYHPQDKDQILFSCGFGKGLYRLNKTNTTQYEKINLPEYQNEIIEGLQFVNPQFLSESIIENLDEEWPLKITTSQKEVVFTPGFESIIIENNKPFSKEPINQTKLERQKIAGGIQGLYLRYDYAYGKRLDNMIKFIKDKNLNAIVIDFKDDNGFITYNSHLELPKKLGAIRPRIKIEDLLKKAKENHIYVIGRIVVFKDEKLYKYANNKYAIWDRISNQPWRHLVAQTDPSTKTTTMVQREFWVDPYHSEVWDYNIMIAEELQSLGVDEIQFDYIRFPTDGDLSRAKYRYRPEGMEKKDALESFLAKAREKLIVPISTDLYGYNCWYRMDSWNGQNMGIFAKYVDVICPMFYPSHFPSGFIKEVPYLERARLIYQEGTNRAYSISGGNCLVRPYIQAFLLGGERRMTVDSYSKYLMNQIEGTLEATSGGFILWNFSNNYYMLTKPLDPVQAINPNLEIDSNTDGE